jgi:hypothetical protein
MGTPCWSFCNEGGSHEELLSWRDLALPGIGETDRDELGLTRMEQDKKVTNFFKTCRSFGCVHEGPDIEGGPKMTDAKMAIALYANDYP